MAFGLPASFQTERELVGSRQAARDATAYAFEQGGWDYTMIDAHHFRAKVPVSALSYGEIVIVSLSVPDKIKILSSGRWPLQVFDWGKNRRNVNQFLVYFSQKEMRDGRISHKDPEYLDEAGKHSCRSDVDRCGSEKVASSV